MVSPTQQHEHWSGAPHPAYRSLTCAVCVEIAAQGMLSLPWLSLVLSRERDPLVRDAMHAHASAGSARLLVP